MVIHAAIARKIRNKSISAASIGLLVENPNNYL